jgi:hypothetical protein
MRNAALHWAAAQWREVTWWMALRGSVGQGANRRWHGTGEDNLRCGDGTPLGCGERQATAETQEGEGAFSSTAIEWSEETGWKVGCEEGPLGKDSASAETAALSSFSRPSWRWDRRHPWARRQRAW